MEDYKKKYEMALERARDYYKANLMLYNADENVVLEDIFPELKESEDERIRKWLISQLKIKSDGTNSDLDTMIDKALAWLEKQGKKQPTIVWHSVSEEPEEMKELFCEWESDDATWHDVAFYDEESHTFRHAKMPINVTKWIYVDELLERQGEQILANSAKTCKIENYQEEGWYSSGDDEYICGISFDEPIKLPVEFYYKKKEVNNDN